MGRAGRFGTRGVAVTLVTDAELEALFGYLEETGGEVCSCTLPLHCHTLPPLTTVFCMAGWLAGGGALGFERVSYEPNCLCKLVF